MVNKEAYFELIDEVKSSGAQLVAVSKTKPAEDIETLLRLSQLDFGENKVQEMTTKKSLLPESIRWHQIGHLQTNKVKMIVPFVHLIHSVDSVKLLREIEKEGKKINRKVNCLLQVHVAQEETKFGLSSEEILDFFKNGTHEEFSFVNFCGIMTMASLTEDEAQIHREFASVKKIFDQIRNAFFPNDHFFKVLSMGMTSDYRIAMQEGSNMVRIGSKIFGSR